MSLEHPTSTTTTIITRICFMPISLRHCLKSATQIGRDFIIALNRPALLKAPQTRSSAPTKGPCCFVPFS